MSAKAQKRIHDMLDRAMNVPSCKDGLFVFYQHDTWWIEPYAIRETIEAWHERLNKNNPPIGVQAESVGT